MANENLPSWPETTDGRIDWEKVFEDPETGLITVITRARSPVALRKSTVFVIEAIYAQGSAPLEIEKFTAELELMLPDNLPGSALPNVAEAVTTVLREIKQERIRQEDDSAALYDTISIDTAISFTASDTSAISAACLCDASDNALTEFLV